MRNSVLCYQKGSMLLTAVFIIITFSVMLAVLAQMYQSNNQIKVNNFIAFHAETVAYTGSEYAMSYLFPLQQCTSATCYSSSYEQTNWKNLWGQSGENLGKKNIIDIEACKNRAHIENDPLCNGVRDGCYISELSIEPKLKKMNSTDTDGYVYTIVSEATCDVPFIETLNIDSPTYQIKRRRILTVTD